jgi:hypothetical protein
MNRVSAIVRCAVSFVVILAGFVLATASPQIGFAQSNLVGTTRKLNVAQSKFSHGPAPTSSTPTYEAVGQGFRVTNEGIDARGNPTKGVAAASPIHLDVKSELLIRGWRAVGNKGPEKQSTSANMTGDQII